MAYAGEGLLMDMQTWIALKPGDFIQYKRHGRKRQILHTNGSGAHTVKALRPTVSGHSTTVLTKSERRQYDPVVPDADEMKVYYSRDDAPVGEGFETWYDKHIEGPLRDLVKYLRNNGINTECSCAHEGWVQCQYMIDGDLYHLHHLLFLYFHNKKRPINYTIHVEHKVREGKSYTSMQVDLPEIPKLPSKKRGKS